MTSSILNCKLIKVKDNLKAGPFSFFQVGIYIFSLLYLYFVAGNNSSLDNFFTLFMSVFTIIVLPAFYLNEDIEFRTDLAINGYLTALKKCVI